MPDDFELTPIEKPLTKAQLYSEIARRADLTKTQVDDVFVYMSDIIYQHIMTGGAGNFTIPGLIKIKSVFTEAKPERMVRNPATGEQMKAAPKPASYKVKTLPLKGLKDMVVKD